MHSQSNKRKPTVYNRICIVCAAAFVSPCNTRKKCEACRKCEWCGAQLVASLRRFCSLACWHAASTGKPKAIKGSPSLRQQARANGAARYFTGNPCPRGHIADRFVSTATCVICAAIVTARYPTSAKLHPDRSRARYKRWRKANPEKRRLADARYQQKNKHGSIKVKNERRKLHPEMIKKHVHAYRARRLSAEGSHTGADIKRLWDSQRHKCAVPKCPYPIAATGKHAYHLDHIIPLSKGGTNWPDNLQCLCGPHNLQKNAKDPEKWAQSLDLPQRLLFLK